MVTWGGVALGAVDVELELGDLAFQEELLVETICDWRERKKPKLVPWRPR